MGCCLSSEMESVKPSTAKVISTSGALHEYSVPVTVSQVLKSETDTPTSFFVCNSDNLFFDSFIPPIDPLQQLQPGQIYFVLPIVKLQYPLSASGMAALAVKASTALSEGSRKESRRRRKIRVLPVLEVNHVDEDAASFDGSKRFEKAGVGLSRSGSVKKMKRSASRRAKAAYLSFRTSLSTIHEGVAAD